jgi:hypothetical protein
MLLSLMIVCAVGAGLLFFLGAFDELRDIWTHPDHKDVDDQWHPPKPKGFVRPTTLSSIPTNRTERRKRVQSSRRAA